MRIINIKIVHALVCLPTSYMTCLGFLDNLFKALTGNTVDDEHGNIANIGAVATCLCVELFIQQGQGAGTVCGTWCVLQLADGLLVRSYR